MRAQHAHGRSHSPLPSLSPLDNPTFADCRLVTGHHWRVAERGMDGPWMFRGKRCTQCHAFKGEWWHWFTGEVQGRWMVHPEGYLLELDGRRRPSQADLRVYLIRRRFALERRVGKIRQGGKRKRRVA